MLLQARLDWKLEFASSIGSTLHSLKDSVENVLEVVIQQLRALEDLENDLEEDGALSIIDGHIWLDREQCLISDLN